MPKLTVITATYNRANILNKHIENIFSQNYKDFEFIIVNDCSSDNTHDILSSIEYPNFKYITHDINKGTNAAIQSGINIAQGEYLYLIADDDKLIDNNFFLNAMEYNEDIISAKYEIVYNNEIISNPFISNQDVYKKDTILKSLELFSQLGFGGNTIFKRSLFDKFIFKVKHDYSAIFLLLLNSKNIRFINSVVFNWYLDTSENTISTRYMNNPYKYIKRDLLFIDELYPILEEKEILGLYENFILSYIFSRFENVKMNYQISKNNDNFQKILSLLEKEVYIYGKGMLSIELKRFLREHSISVISFIDDLQTDTDILKLKNSNKNRQYIICTYKDNIKIKMYKNLIQHGVCYKNIIELGE
jgi:glycosyltransferase involved in cell wall biosynthesis